ncbi:co-chaperone GroES family protein [Prosthecobacter sp.]|uniref:co-chaperone GroES family protein n=1 Tax=Prosthecobacter sp. TaxID=1965333 RepID=UPI0037843916
MHTPGIHPLSNHLLLDVTPQEQTTTAGIVLPTAVQGAVTRMEGTIVSCGPTVSLNDLSAGQRVLVSRYTSGEVPRDGRIYKLAQQADVIAILD